MHPNANIAVPLKGMSCVLAVGLFFVIQSHWWGKCIWGDISVIVTLKLSHLNLSAYTDFPDSRLLTSENAEALSLLCCQLQFTGLSEGFMLLEAIAFSTHPQLYRIVIPPPYEEQHNRFLSRLKTGVLLVQYMLFISTFFWSAEPIMKCCHGCVSPHSHLCVWSILVDIWSVGCIMAEMINGKTLFKGKDCILSPALVNPPLRYRSSYSRACVLVQHKSMKIIYTFEGSQNMAFSQQIVLICCLICSSSHKISFCMIYCIYFFMPAFADV